METDQTCNYNDCTWFRPFLNEIRPTGESKPLDNGCEFLVDNHARRFLDRYFDIAYMPDVGHQYRNDLCILRHSNGLYVVGLAFGHHLFRGCQSEDQGTEGVNCVQELPPHRIVNLDFQVSKNVNRLDTEVRGRKKHGAQFLSQSTDPIAIAVCNRGVKHILPCGVPGRLLEVNTNFGRNPASDMEAEAEKTLETKGSYDFCINPLGYNSDEILKDKSGSYLGIIATSYRKAKGLLNSYNLNKKIRRSAEASDECNGVEVVAKEGEEGEEEKEECQDDSSNGKNEMASEAVDWITALRIISGERCLVLEDYQKLRGL
ncbi:unnamed protein product [Calicophoron daubneyi]|uniref:Uncharacterized protein n=1 Tax=Calicophoron daubneyi TaxID=300641 RepID=A0AAV2TZY0_CALDB